MFSLLSTLLAYLIDKKFGEFSFFIHPVILIGRAITYFESHYYEDSIKRGAWLVVCMLSLLWFISTLLEFFLSLFPSPIELLLTAFIASTLIAHKMLRDSVLAVLNAKNKRKEIAKLVSRDTQNMSESEVYKAAIETYAENLSDGVIAPLFYLLFFNLTGLILYKTINTLDSMVGYENTKYINYGKVAARVDDIANFIPSRLTALLIMYLAKKKPYLSFYTNGSLHESPNAGHPITAMALALTIKLGGDTSYFGEMKKKAHFGKGREKIIAEDVKRALEVL